MQKHHRQAKEELSEELGREPTPEEIENRVLDMKELRLRPSEIVGMLPKSNGNPLWYQESKDRIIRQYERDIAMYAEKRSELIAKRQITTDPEVLDLIENSIMSLEQDIDDRAQRIEELKAETFVDHFADQKFDEAKEEKL